MERNLREVIGNKLVLNSPPLLLSLIFFLKSMLSSFQQTIKIDCLCWATFHRFYWLVSLIFDLAPSHK